MVPPAKVAKAFWPAAGATDIRDNELFLSVLAVFKKDGLIVPRRRVGLFDGVRRAVRDTRIGILVSGWFVAHAKNLTVCARYVDDAEL